MFEARVNGQAAGFAASASRPAEVERLLQGAAAATGMRAESLQVLLVIAARFGRVAGVAALYPFPWRTGRLSGVRQFAKGRAMGEVTRILLAIEQGDTHAAEQLWPLVYDEMRKLAAQKLAHEKAGQTLQATALVHEAYLRLVAAEGGASGPGPHWDNRRHFFAAAAEAMRRILVDRARDKGRLKRGGGWRRMRLDQIDLPIDESADNVLAVHEALEKLAQEDALCAELVKLRIFAGLTLTEAAATLSLSRRTAHRYWAFARSWLYEELRRGDEAAEG